MNILLVLIPVSVLLIALAIWAFFWAVDNGQFDDLDAPALNMLQDDPEPRADQQVKPTKIPESPP